MIDVFLLGAGFSRAIFPAMPLLKDLSRRVRDSYDQPIPSDIAALLDENFELALSYLAQPKPWLPETDNLRHRALLLDLTNLIAGVINSAAAETVSAMDGKSPDWLVRIIQYWHAQQSSVLTLNYDTLIEDVAGGIRVGKDGTYLHQCFIYPPLLMDAGFRAGLISAHGDDITTFQLLKLHGSVNWFFSGRQESFGEAIYLVPKWGGPTALLKKQTSPNEIRYARSLSDKVPFIIPPLFEKASLFSHETVRSLWYQAARALEKATRLVCIGYSLPESDLTMRHFLKSSLGDREVIVEIVNLAPDLGTSYQRSLGPGSYKLSQTFSGNNCVQEFVESLPI